MESFRCAYLIGAALVDIVIVFLFVFDISIVYIRLDSMACFKSFVVLCFSVFKSLLLAFLFRSMDFED
jgi:hypothetical protein